MTDLEKEVAIALRESFCLLKQKAFRMITTDPNEVARVAVKAVLEYQEKDRLTIKPSLLY